MGRKRRGTQSELSVGSAELRPVGSLGVDCMDCGAGKQRGRRAWGRKRREGDGSGAMWAWQPPQCAQSSEPRPVCHEGGCREGAEEAKLEAHARRGRGRLSKEPRTEVLGEPGTEPRKERGLEGKLMLK